MLPTLTPIDTIGYTYNSTDWTDQLVSYNGQTISYDEMGNPLTYRGYTFGWRGKQLTTASNGTDTLSFEYNEDGLRQQKTVNNVDTDYFYNGSVLIGMQRGTDKLLFSYDAAGNVVSVNYNGTEYYYLRNAQGDIVKIIDAAGEPVVIYTYDTWGKKVTTTGSLATTLGTLQPFRYRGYVYDEETGFYYLQSRYYDPTICRFISADVLLSTGQGVMGHNAFAYCLDNPVRYIDSQGKEAEPATPEDEQRMEEFKNAYRLANGEEYQIQDAETYSVSIQYGVEYDSSVGKTCTVIVSAIVTVIGFLVAEPLIPVIAGISIICSISDLQEMPSTGTYTVYTITYSKECKGDNLHPQHYDEQGCKGNHKYLVEEVYYGEKGDNDRMYPFERRTMAVCLK